MNESEGTKTTLVGALHSAGCRFRLMDAHGHSNSL